VPYVFEDDVEIGGMASGHAHEPPPFAQEAQGDLVAEHREADHQPLGHARELTLDLGVRVRGRHQEVAAQLEQRGHVRALGRVAERARAELLRELLLEHIARHELRARIARGGDEGSGRASRRPPPREKESEECQPILAANRS
jgi:hypothetical protein